MARLLADLSARRDEGVLQDRHAAEEPRVLEATHHTPGENLVRLEGVDSLALEEDGSAVGLVDARDDVEQGRLAASVRPDEPDELPLPDVGGHAVHGVDAAEALPHVFEPKEGLPGSFRSHHRGLPQSHWMVPVR